MLHRLVFNLIFILMSKTNVLQRPSVDVATGRHDFDRGYVLNSTQSAGELRAVMCEPLVAGSKGVVNAQRFTRTADVVYPAFQQVDQHIDFFMVPIRYLWSRWNDWKVNINDLNSSALVDWNPLGTDIDLSQPVSVPRMNFGAKSWDDVSYTQTELADFIKLVDDLDYGLCNLARFSGSTPDNCVMSLFKLAAYQKVYYDHYRNSIYEANNPYAYNLDWLQDNANLLDPTDGAKERKIIKWLTQKHFVNYRNDYFNNIYPSLDYSLNVPNGQEFELPSNVVGVASFTNPNSLQNFTTKNDFYRWHDVNQTTLTGSEAVSTNVSAGGQSLGISSGRILHDHVIDSASITPQQIRAMFALDKLRRAAAYAPKHVRQQFEALYGVKISDRVSSESIKLGSLMNDIVFGEVTSTSDTLTATSGQKLGAISGKGIGSSPFGKDIHFYAEEDSILIGIQYFIPRAQYDNLGVDEWNTKLVRSDFFIRQFEHLGLRPMLMKNLMALGSSTFDNLILGYTEANMRYKVGIDKNKSTFSRSVFTAGIDSGTGDPIVVAASNSAGLTPFVVHSDYDKVYGTQVTNGVDYQYFKCYPKHLDPIFSVNYSNTDPLTDQFYFNIRFKFAVNAPMDIHSQPFL